MDDHRSADALTGAALDREIEAALAVDPSPEFVARVRTRVQTERDASWSPWQWGVAGAAGALVVAVAVVVGTSRPNRSQMAEKAPVAQPPSQGFGEPRRSSPDQSASGGGDFGPAPGSVPAAPVNSPVPVAQDFSPAPSTTPRKADAPSSRRGGSRNEPEAIFAAGEARALRRLVADVRNGLIDLSSLQEGAPATAALQPPGEIAFPPITFEPIAIATTETAEEGERQ